MKKVIYFCLSMFATSNVAAIGGVGDVVTDPTSYPYYAEQIKIAQEAYANAKEHLQTALEAKDIADKTRSNLEGTYRRAQQALSDFKSMREQLENDPARFAVKMIEDRRDLSDVKNDTARKVQSVFDPVKSSMDDINELAGNDASGNEWSSDWISVKAAQKKVVQEELQRAIVDAEVAESLTASQLKNIEDLASKANSAVTQKDATDVTNALLLQMIDQNQQLIKLVANISRNLAMTELTNKTWVKDDPLAEADESLDKKTSKGKPRTSLDGILDKMKEYGYE
jgi:conjugal transfer/entry exclusion protein